MMYDLGSAGQPPVSFTPTEFVAVVNQTLEYAYSSVVLVGEVASFKVNQGKWVFFDIKDEETNVGCFMSLYQLRVPLEDGMKVAVRGVPKLTKWGKFSFTVTAVQPVGEGSIKKAFEMLKKKLAAEGLFDAGRKRAIGKNLGHIGVISSTGAAGYADFVKILNARWGGMKVSVAHTQVQGMDAARQIVRALQYFNERGEVEAIAIIRGGGSADDLACFNDEELVRAVAASRIPVITGIGHEVDESLVDLAADVRASTPSNAAEMLTTDRIAVRENIVSSVKRVGIMMLDAVQRESVGNHDKMVRIGAAMNEKITRYVETNRDNLARVRREVVSGLENMLERVEHKKMLLEALNPDNVLKQGYAMVTGGFDVGSVVKITTFDKVMDAEIKKVCER